MKAHIDAIRVLLEPYGKPVHFVDVPEAPTYPYVLLWTSAGRMVSDEVCGKLDDLNDILGVTIVGATPDAVLVATPRVRSYLMDKQPQVANRHVQPLRLFDSQNVDVDTDVTVPATNRHPAFAVDLYRLISEPA